MAAAGLAILVLLYLTGRSRTAESWTGETVADGRRPGHDGALRPRAGAGR